MKRNISGTRKRPVEAYRCPVCKSGYRHRSMAEYCTKTEVCRLYNTPPAEVRDMWRFASGCASLGCCFAHPLFDLEFPELHEEAGEVQTAAEAIYAVLHQLFPCSDHIRRSLHADLMNTVACIWMPRSAVDMGHIGDVVRSVLCDALMEAKTRRVPDAVLEALTALEERVEALYAALVPEGEASYEADTIVAIERVSDVVIGPKPEGRKPSLYLVNGRHLVVGRGRADVRRVMLEFGLSKPCIQGINPGEKFEDGRTPEDIIKAAVRVPALIGRMEE